jgi:hypothetical protein
MILQNYLCGAASCAELDTRCASSAEIRHEIFEHFSTYVKMWIRMIVILPSKSFMVVFFL